eukprot:425792-Rhodomonas_salina.1
MSWLSLVPAPHTAPEIRQNKPLSCYRLYGGRRLSPLIPPATESIAFAVQTALRLRMIAFDFAAVRGHACLRNNPYCA